MSEKLSLVFFGSGPVAADSLRLLSQEFSIEAVVTKPTTKHEMHSACPGTPIFTAVDKKELDSLMVNQVFSSRVGILIDFGILVSQETINSFEKGIINSHFSLLPELRGADPISFSILEGKQETGVSLMLLVEAMDEGPIIAQESLALDYSETTPLLTNSLINISYSLLKKNLRSYLSGVTKPAEQETLQKSNGKSISYTRKLTKTDGIIDWNKSASEIEKEVRAFSGWPKSQTKLNGIEVIVLEVNKIDKSGVPGNLFLTGDQLGVYCGSEALVIKTLIPAGKKTMDSKAFLAGYKARLEI